MTFDVATTVGSVLKSDAAVGGICVKSGVATKIRLVVGSGVGLTNADADRTDNVDGLNHSVDFCPVESLDFDLPDRKSLLKNPRFLTFCSTENMSSVSGAAREMFVEESWVSSLFNNDERGRVCCDWKRDIFVIAVDAKAGPGSNCGSRF